MDYFERVAIAYNEWANPSHLKTIQTSTSSTESVGGAQQYGRGPRMLQSAKVGAWYCIAHGLANAYRQSLVLGRAVAIARAPSSLLGRRCPAATILLLAFLPEPRIKTVQVL